MQSRPSSTRWSTAWSGYSGSPEWKPTTHTGAHSVKVGETSTLDVDAMKLLVRYGADPTIPTRHPSGTVEFTDIPPDTTQAAVGITHSF